MVKEKNKFFPCQNWIHHQLWQINGGTFTKKPQIYTPRRGDITILRKLATRLFYPPILNFILDNLKKIYLPEVFSLKDKKIRDFGSLLSNPIVIEKLMVTRNMCLSTDDQLKYIDNGPYSGNLTIKQIEDFLYYFWFFNDNQLKDADQALMNIKNPSKLTQVYSRVKQGKSGENVLFFHINQNSQNASLVKTIKNTLIYNADQLEIYPANFNLDQAEQTIKILTGIVNIAEKLNKLDE